MPTCSETYGPNWVGEYPNCRYEASTPAGQGQQPEFTGTVGSLGFESLLPSWDDYSKYFDPYDPTEEEMSTRAAGIDIGQLQSAWDLQSGQLGEALGLGRQQQGETWRLQSAELGGQWAGQQQELGAGARRGYQDVTRMGEQMLTRGRGLTFGEQSQRQAEEEVSGAYARSFGLGQSAYERAMESGQSRYRQALEAGTMGYEQAMETGELALQQATTDIYQGLESDVFGQRQDWRSEQRATLNTLLGMGLDLSGTGGTGGGGDNQEGWITCCDGTSQPMAALCGVGNQPWECYANEKGGSNPPAGTCTDPNMSYQCADGTCVGSAMECIDTGTGTGTGAGTNTGGGTGGGDQSGAQRYFDV